MRIGVLTFEQQPTDTPEHFISKALASKFQAHFHNGKPVAQQIDPRTLRITVPVPFGKLKALLKSERSADYPIQIPHPEMSLIPAFRYPIQLAPHNLETAYR